MILLPGSNVGFGLAFDLYGEPVTEQKRHELFSGKYSDAVLYLLL